MELGGKAPVVVTANADLEAAAAAIRFGGFFHSGQICMATQTAIVHESVADKLLAIIQAGFPLEASGDSSKGAPLRGLFTQASADRVKGIIDDALTKGATIGAGKNSVEGNVVQPLLLTDVTPEMGECEGRRTLREASRTLTMIYSQPSTRRRCLLPYSHS